MIIILFLFFFSFCTGGFMVPESLYATNIRYVGAKKCRICHKKQYRSWKKTNMANAFDLLKANNRVEAKKEAGLDPSKDYTSNKTCLPCHTTGYKEPGGFVDAEKTPKMMGIQCESCHGPGNLFRKLMRSDNFTQEEIKEAGLIIPDKSTCIRCHNEKSPFFRILNFEKYIKNGIHAHSKHY